VHRPYPAVRLDAALSFDEFPHRFLGIADEVSRNEGVIAPPCLANAHLIQIFRSR
jgi:hypothetical protein